MIKENNFYRINGCVDDLNNFDWAACLYYLYFKYSLCIGQNKNYLPALLAGCAYNIFSWLER